MARQGSSGAPPGGLQRIQNFRQIADLGSGNFGVAKLMLDLSTNTLVAVKFIERGDKIDRNVEREIMNHCTLNHPNIVGFKEVFLTPTHLAIVMEYAAGGELFERIVKAGRFSEDEARYFFQQLISGVDYCHRSGVCHRDLKLENTLLDDNPAPRLKICDFGYSKSALDSQPKSTVGTPAYIAPEVLQRKGYDGQMADVWSTGVTLYVMLVGAYPFEDPQDPRNFRKTIQRIMAVQYAMPDRLNISASCRDLLSRIFVANPAQRITLQGIKQHPWFLTNLPVELADPSMYTHSPAPPQSQEQIRALIHAARTPHGSSDECPPDEFEMGESMADDLSGPEPVPVGASLRQHHIHQQQQQQQQQQQYMQQPQGAGDAQARQLQQQQQRQVFLLQQHQQHQQHQQQSVQQPVQQRQRFPGVPVAAPAHGGWAPHSH